MAFLLPVALPALSSPLKPDFSSALPCSGPLPSSCRMGSPGYLTPPRHTLSLRELCPTPRLDGLDDTSPWRLADLPNLTWSKRDTGLFYQTAYGPIAVNVTPFTIARSLNVVPYVPLNSIFQAVLWADTSCLQHGLTCSFSGLSSSPLSLVISDSEVLVYGSLPQPRHAPPLMHSYSKLYCLLCGRRPTGDPALHRTRGLPFGAYNLMEGKTTPLAPCLV